MKKEYADRKRNTRNIEYSDSTHNTPRWIRSVILKEQINKLSKDLAKLKRNK